MSLNCTTLCHFPLRRERLNTLATISRRFAIVVFLVAEILVICVA